MSTILSARAVTKTYRTGAQPVVALRGGDLDATSGGAVTVMRPCGNG